MALSLAWLRNLVRSGLGPNGPSNSASRHRQRRSQRQGHAPSQVAGDDHPPSHGDRIISQLEINQPLPEGRTSKLGGTIRRALCEHR